VTNLIDSAPYLAPWYFGKDKPQLFKDGKALSWKQVSEKYSGILALIDSEDKCYALLDMVTYLLPASDGKSFLIWQRDLEKVIGLQTIEILYFEVDKLQIITNYNDAIVSMREKKQLLSFTVGPTSTLSFKMNPIEDSIKIDIPPDFKKFEEFIFITELENLYINPDPKAYWHNTTMLLINTNTGLVFNYPQDWFNKSNEDYMYVWITRAIRDPATKRIHGQGIRLPDFILDETNRQILVKGFDVWRDKISN